jgi:hypothetical protein
MIALAIGAFFTALALANELFRRSLVLTGLAFIVFPAVMTPHWIRSERVDWFLWAKLYSVVGGIVLMQLFRFTRVAKTAWGARVLWVVLFANILEAVVHDATSVGIWHRLNALSGVLLILSQPSARDIHVDESSPHRDLVWDMRWGWILGYTLWNWTFVETNFTEGAARHVAILGVPLFASLLRGSGAWIQARAFILGVDLLMRFTDDIGLRIAPAPRSWYAGRIGVVGVVVALCWTVTHVALYRLPPLLRRRAAASLPEATGAPPETPPSSRTGTD